MSEFTPIEIVTEDRLAELVSNGLMEPVDPEDEWEVIDCGDGRPLTEASQALRHQQHGEVTPGRYFGTVHGMGMTALMTVTAQTGERFMASYVDQYSAEAFAVFGSDIAARASERSGGLDLTTHSANGNEGNDLVLADHDTAHGDQLGCKFLTYAGAILEKAGGERALYEAQVVAAQNGQWLPLKEVSESARLLSGYIPPDFGVGRETLQSAINNPAGRTSIAILEGSAVQSDQTAVVIDMAGYRSDAGAHLRAGTPRYHHTPGIASELTRLLPEYKMDESLLAASSLLIGTATREALSGAETPHDLRIEVIPADYAA